MYPPGPAEEGGHQVIMNRMRMEKKDDSRHQRLVEDCYREVAAADAASAGLGRQQSVIIRATIPLELCFATIHLVIM